MWAELKRRLDVVHRNIPVPESVVEVMGGETKTVKWMEELIKVGVKVADGNVYQAFKTSKGMVYEPLCMEDFEPWPNNNKGKFYCYCELDYKYELMVGDTGWVRRLITLGMRLPHMCTYVKEGEEFVSYKPFGEVED